MINNLARLAIKNGGDILPLVLNSEYKTGLLNPGLYFDGNKLYINVRHVQYVLYHSENNQFFQSKWGPLAYLHPEHDNTLRTVNYFGTLKNNTLSVTKVDTTRLDVTPVWEFIGLEDARVVIWDKKIYLCGVRRDTTTHGQGRMEISEVKLLGDVWKEMKRFRLDTPFSNDTYCEKNWVPINDKPYHFLKWSNPIEIVKVNLEETVENGNYKCEQIFLSEKTHNLPRDIRGGTNLIKWGGGYLTIAHEVNLFKSELKNKDAFYFHRILYLNKDFELEKVSDSFNFLTGNVEFATGLVLFDKDFDNYKKNDVLITFGFQDNSAFMMKTTRSFIDGLLETIG